MTNKSNLIRKTFSLEFTLLLSFVYLIIANGLDPVIAILLFIMISATVANLVESVFSGDSDEDERDSL